MATTFNSTYKAIIILTEANTQMRQIVLQSRMAFDMLTTEQLSIYHQNRMLHEYT